MCKLHTLLGVLSLERLYPCWTPPSQSEPPDSCVFWGGSRASGLLVLSHVPRETEFFRLTTSSCCGGKFALPVTVILLSHPREWACTICLSSSQWCQVGTTSSTLGMEDQQLQGRQKQRSQLEPVAVGSVLGFQKKHGVWQEEHVKPTPQSFSQRLHYYV